MSMIFYPPGIFSENNPDDNIANVMNYIEHLRNCIEESSRMTVYSIKFIRACRTYSFSYEYVNI